MSEERFEVRCTVYAIVIKDNKILLYRRINTGWEDGKYNFPGGHLEANESVIDACIRETKEESGIDVTPSDLELAHVMHRYPKEGSIETNKNVVDLFFKIKSWTGEASITEEYGFRRVRRRDMMN